ncbi:sugar phosphate isomerase/epimerase [bacterium]|nr:sugar phosphate isomerase/epimerase [bacterium]
MGNKLKIDTGTTAFSSCSDRFVKKGYREQISFERQLEMLAKVEGITGVALDYPTQYRDPVKLKKLLKKVGLQLGMTEIDMYSDRHWKFGSLSALDKKIRKEAVSLVKRGMDAAVEAEGADVQLWLGQDGYDYPFQADYSKAWNYLIESITEIANYRKDIKIVIEYKIKEPRNRIFISTIGKALLICERIGLSHVGITLDVGHSLMALENPAESAVLALNSGRLFHLHLNDNYRDWDHDMLPGTVNLWETLELFYWLEKMNFNGWYGIDIYPYREDGTKALTQTVKYIKKMAEIAEELEKSDIDTLQQKGDLLKIIDFLRRKILR